MKNNHKNQVNIIINLKQTNKKNTLTLRCGLRRKNVHSRGFRVFDFALYLKSKTWKVFVYFNFLWSWLHHMVVLNIGKIKTFH